MEPNPRADGPGVGVQLPPGHGSQRRLDRAFAALDQIPTGAFVTCLDQGPGRPTPPRLVNRLTQACWVDGDQHPLASIEPDHHLRVHRAWVDARDGSDRIGRSRVRTSRPLVSSDGSEVGSVGSYHLVVIDLTGVDAFDVIVVALQPVDPADRDMDLAADEFAETSGAPSWFRGTTSFRLRLDQFGVIEGGTLNVAEVLGRPLVDLLGTSVQKLAHADDLAAAREAWARLTAKEGDTAYTRSRLAMADGSWRWFEVTSWNVLEVPQFGVVIAEFRDVQDQVEAELARLATAQAHDRLVHVFDEVDDMVMVEQLGVGLVYVNEAAAAALGDDAVGRRLVDLIQPAELREFALAVIEPGTLRLERWTGDLEVEVGGRRRIMATTVTPVSEVDQDEIYVGVILRDVTAERSHALALADQARLDPLTGLPNRMALMERLETCRTTGDPDGTVSVCFIDLDNLKIVNDGLGHSAGDRLLRAVGAQLLALPDGIVARFGGDEFVVVYEDRSADETSEAAEDLLTAIRRVQVAGVSTHITASVGVATCRRDELDPEAVIRDADAAMYVAKRSGRARVVHFDEPMREVVSRRFVLESSLRQALADDRLEIHLQPVVSLATGAVGGFEALSRWDAAAPAEFIPIAEDSGLIEALGRWALHRSLAAQVRISAIAPEFAQVRMGVNVSGHQLLDRGFPDMVLEALEEHDVDPGRLVLELTESVLIDPRDETDKVLRGLRDVGIWLALDDFGSGYSSLGHLRRYPIDVLKLDNSYTQALLHDQGTRIIAEAMVTMARRLGLQVVAEGVETDEQLEVVRGMGIDWVQGFLLGRPAPVDQVVAALSASGR